MKIETITELIEYQASARPDEIFITEPEPAKSVTYSEFHSEIEELAASLKRAGLTPGDRVSTIFLNSISAAVAFFGIIYAGGIAVPINPGLKEKEISYILSDSNSRFVVTSSELLIRYAEQLSFSRKFHAVKGICGFQLDTTRAASSCPAALALILYTSGTTGPPKGVMLSHENLLAEASHISEAHELTNGDTVLCVLPFYHINGLVVTLITPLLRGIQIILPKKFSVSRFWRWISYYQVRWFSAVPTIITLILNQPIPEDADISQLKFARSASSALPPAILNTFETKFHIPVIESYGISEGGSQITTNPLPPCTRKPGSVGLPFGNQILIADEKGRKLPSGTIGEVLVKGKNIAAGYLNKPAETTASFIGSWFHTGDLGYVDEEGYLYLDGRKKELINRAGEKFSPKEIDDILYELPEVELAAAVGIPDPLYGEEVIAYVKLRQNFELKEKDIISHCQTKLADFKVPKQIYYIDKFPKGPSGKIQRLKLVEHYKNSKECNKL